MRTGNFRFSKSERLKSTKLISRIFTDGIFLYSSHLSVKYILDKNSEIPFHQAGFSVPKKKFKTAVQRNRLKRLMREAYRLNKYLLDDFIKTGNYFRMMFIIRSGKMIDFSIVRDNMIELLKRLSVESEN